MKISMYSYWSSGESMYISKPYRGRPVDIEKRQEKEKRCYDFLDNIGVEYEVVDHDEASDMEKCREIEGALGVKICKNIVLCNRQETVFFLFMMPGDKKYVTKDISKKLEVSRLSFAKENYLKEFLDVTPGSVSVLGLLNDKDNRVDLVIDSDVIKENFIRCHPCVNTSTLKIATTDFLNKVIPALNKEAKIIDNEQ
jgi:conserved hypothetical protein